MKKGIIYAAIKERKVTLFIVMLLIGVGFFSYKLTPKIEAPKIDLTFAVVTAIYPGASPSEIEMSITRKIEEVFTEVPGYMHSSSTSKNSVVTAVIELEYGTDTEKAWADLRTKLSDLEDEFPEGCEIVDINTELTKTAGFILSVSGEYSKSELNTYSQRIKEELGLVDHISQMEIMGSENEKLVVEVEINKLNQLPLTLQGLIDLVKAQNMNIPLGKMDYEENKINVVSNGKYETVEEIGNTIIGMNPKNGTQIRLKDIAKVTLSTDDNHLVVNHNGDESLLIVGYFSDGFNIINIGKDLDYKLREVTERLPNNLKIEKVLYQPSDVSMIIDDFIMNLLLGIVFVIIIVFISMGLRNAVIVSTAIPITIFITFITMNVMDVQFHKVSIAALIIALGMLVDNAIVVSDSIQNLLDDGEERFKACVEGTRSIAMPVLTSSLTTVGAFIPLLLMDSVIGSYIASIPKIIMMSLSISYLVAILVTPTLAFIFLRPKKRKIKNPISKRIIMSTLKLSLQNRVITLGVVVMLIGLTFVMVKQLGLQFFPNADKDLIYLNIIADKSNDFELTKKLTEDVMNILKSQEEVVEYTASIGSGLPKFWDTLPPVPRSVDNVQILVKLDLKKTGQFETNSQFSDYLQEQIDENNIEGGAISVKQLEQGIPMSAPITAKISGENIDEIETRSNELMAILQEIEGTINVRTDQPKTFEDMKIVIDTEKSSTMGLTKVEIQREIRTALEGEAASSLKNKDEELDILVIGNASGWEDLSELKIKSSLTGEKVLLRDVAEIEIISQPSSIKRYDRKYNINLLSDVKSGYSSIEIQKVFQERLNELTLNEIEVSFDGEQENIQKNFSDVGIKAIFAVLVIFIILLIQFNSFSQPLIILITIPLSAIGAIAGLFLSGQTLSFTALLGLVSLFGIVVNNAIILIDFINRERDLGKPIAEACMDAIDKRFRPIVLTTTTTVIGLVPLITMGSELFSPMAIAIASGLLFSTLLTMIVVPVIYSFLGGKRREGQV